MSVLITKRVPLQKLTRRIAHLGGRTITAMIAALIAALLLFASPEIGIAGAIGGVVIGGFSAILMHPHRVV